MPTRWTAALIATTLACLFLPPPLAAQTVTNEMITSKMCEILAAQGPRLEDVSMCKGDSVAVSRNRQFHACRSEHGAETDRIRECLITGGWTSGETERYLTPYKARMSRDSASGDAYRQYHECNTAPNPDRIHDCLIAQFGWTRDSAERFLEPRREALNRESRDALRRDSTEKAFLATRMIPCVAARDSTILVYDAASADTGVSPIRALGGARTCLGFPVDMASNGQGELYVLGRGPMITKQLWGNAVTVFAPGDSGDARPRRRILVPSSYNVEPGIGLDRRGNLYVTTGGAVQVYPPDADGVTKPMRVLAGDATRLQGPSDVSFDSHGDMYVVNPVGRITIYRGDADGNDAPLRVIEGPHTGLMHPVKLAFGAGDTLFVVNGLRMESRMYPLDVTVTVYAPGADGDDAPVRTLIVRGGGKSAGLRRGLGTAEGLAMDRRGVLYVATFGALAVYAPGAEGDVEPTRFMRLSEPVRYDWGRSILLDDAGRLYVSIEKIIAGF